MTGPVIDWLTELQTMRETISRLEAENDRLSNRAYKMRETIIDWEILAANLRDVLKKAPGQ